MASPYASEAFFQQLLGKAVGAGASDVHLKVGQPPGARVGGEIVYFRVDRIRPEDTLACAGILLGDRASALDALTEMDSSYSVTGLGRFRVNIYRQRGTIAIVLRAIPHVIPTFESLGVPPIAAMLAEKERGLVLIVGAAGNGKSSTMAAMIGHVNHNFARHIVTIEDPIEFLHVDERASVSQREVGTDTPSFAHALRSALRQDPDIVLVGEIRDAETMEIVLQAAETGHLVLSTVHTPDVARTVGRLLALSRGSPEARDRIADSLQGVIAQRLVPRADGQGLVLAAEALYVTGTVRESLKAPERNPPLKELMEKGVTPYGMQTFEMHLRHLEQHGVISKETLAAEVRF